LTTGQEIADEVRGQLNDGDTLNLRWTDAEMLRFVNAGQRQIVQLVPEANVVQEVVVIAAGSGSRQTLPTDGVKFIDVWNYDDTANETGAPIRAVERDALDSFMPEWSYESEIAARWNWPSNEAEFSESYFEAHIHDPRDPKTYHLFPPADTVTPFSVHLTFSKLPTALASLASTFDLGDEYVNAAVEYVAFRALMKDGRYGNNSQRRQELWNNFRQALGLKIEAEQRVDPNSARPPGDQNG